MSDDSAGPEYDTDVREHPDEYEIGRGEEGVLQPPFFRSGSLPAVAHPSLLTGASHPFAQFAEPSVPRQRKKSGPKKGAASRRSAATTSEGLGGDYRV
ncbi:hypothetical protein [Natronococcus pandeyae]|uniref:hypothetical protein n=1 Tax=Natronococcus pandeyae TaxID=2055836 RepID=UPI001652B88A|nr:hypothetical protein [Natronococcus pandeyae]